MTTAVLISSYYAAFNSGDREEFLQLLTEDVAHDLNQGGREIGIPAFRAFLARMDWSYAEQVEELTVLVHPEDATRAAAEFFIRGKYLQTDEGLPPARGQPYFLRVGAFFEVREGKVCRITNYYNLQEWLRQIGA